MDMLTTAAENRSAVNDLLRSLDLAASELGYDYVALLLDTDPQTLRQRLDGAADMTLSELSALCIATGMTVRVHTVPTELVTR